jgi:hypothetical protein
MPDFRHLFPQNTGNAEKYTYSGTVVTGEFRVNARDNLNQHARDLIAATVAATSRDATPPPAEEATEEPAGVVIEFISDPGFKLQLNSMEALRSGIELRNARIVDGVMYATVFIKEGKVGHFTRKFEAYLNATTPSGKPRHNELVESVSRIRRAALSSFWTDVGAFPVDADVVQWWEVWLRDSEDVVRVFKERATATGILVSERDIRFPERRVMLANASINQLTSVTNLFDILAEIRLAKFLAAEFLELPPRAQGDFVDEALGRITPPPLDAPSVSHLDSGVNNGHPLLELALSSDSLFTCNPEWGTNDQKGHGTEMAGIALYGDLIHLLNEDAPRVLRHRLESVKIYSTAHATAPELYGDITSQAVSLLEIAAAERKRALCLTVTTDGRDEGFPSSWSAAIDQISSGANGEGQPQRLFFISAGNTPDDERHNYPDHNHLHGVADPAQAFNAISVGAFTEMTTIHEEEYADWKPVAPRGRISPSSRTSIVWQNKTWPIKPDIVMEGGNSAINPANGKADYVDDLSLLTTRVSEGGSLFTTTGDTSAAAALAARYAAIIWAFYPNLRPETVRALLIHSARWTPEMRREFPKAKRHNRMRAYGYGVPNLHLALWSASNIATSVIEDSIQPFEKTPTRIKTKDMKIHQLPWPKDVLEQLGEVEVRMRITLSYFIEPSPGRRGWRRKQRYQSHGLRFAIKRPEETDKIFRDRISSASWDEDDEASNDEVGEDLEWQNGGHLQAKGSVHSDVWTGTAAQLASCGSVAVFPISGWWRDRPHLMRFDSIAPYSLLITLETDDTTVDLYTPIAQQIGVDVVTAIET